jgi:hypothetical protein
MSDSTCSTEGCERKIYFRGKCHGHYVRVGPQRAGTCTIDGCTAKAKCQKMCEMHYTRYRRHGDPEVTLRAPQRSSLVERLEFTGWTEVVRRPDLGPCWEWNGGKYESGYGQVSTPGDISRPAHRMAYIAWVGPLEDGQHACHKCDNPPCMNPSHIFPGTRKDNMQDCAQKDRTCHGERHGGHKLTEGDVRDIRAVYATGSISQRALGEAYGVEQSNISAIVRGKTWARVA